MGFSCNLSSPPTTAAAISTDAWNVRLLWAVKTIGLVVFLMVDVSDHVTQLRMRIGKCPKPFLPRKPTHHPMLLVDVVG